MEQPYTPQLMPGSEFTFNGQRYARANLQSSDLWQVLLSCRARHGLLPSARAPTLGQVRLGGVSMAQSFSFGPAALAPLEILESAYEEIKQRHDAVRHDAHGRGSAKQWTIVEALLLLQLWVAGNNTLPTTKECDPAGFLPDMHTVFRLFGTHKAYVAHAATLLVPEHLESTTCLKCDRVWQSPDKKRFRICKKCKAAISAQHGDETGSWMNNSPVIEETIADVDLLHGLSSPLQR